MFPHARVNNTSTILTAPTSSTHVDIQLSDTRIFLRMNIWWMMNLWTAHEPIQAKRKQADRASLVVGLPFRTHRSVRRGTKIGSK